MRGIPIRRILIALVIVQSIAILLLFALLIFALLTSRVIHASLARARRPVSFARWFAHRRRVLGRNHSACERERSHHRRDACPVKPLEVWSSCAKRTPSPSAR